MNKIIGKISIPLAVVLLMFPQIVETMYSPALTSVKNHFGVSGSEAAQAMSIFFIAFAFGVVFWGRMCDVIGRRVSTLLGLTVFIIAALFTMLAPTFTLMLTGFGCCAFGAAVGSVCTQTILRDSFEGAILTIILYIYYLYINYINKFCNWKKNYTQKTTNNRTSNSALKSIWCQSKWYCYNAR